MGKLIGYARVSRREQDPNRQGEDILAAGVRLKDLYTDQGASGATTPRPGFDAAVEALESGDILVVATLDRLARSTTAMLSLAETLRRRGAGLRVLNFGGGDVNTSTPEGGMVLTVLAALAEMEVAVRRERLGDRLFRRRAAGMNLGGRPPRFTAGEIESARALMAAGKPIAQVARDLGMSRSTLYRRMS